MTVSGCPWTEACQTPLSMRFPRQEYWSGLPFSSPGDLLNPGIEPGSPTLQADSLLSEPPGMLYITVFLRTKTLIKQAGGQIVHSGLQLSFSSQTMYSDSFSTSMHKVCTLFLWELLGVTEQAWAMIL